MKTRAEYKKRNERAYRTTRHWCEQENGCNTDVQNEREERYRAMIDFLLTGGEVVAFSFSYGPERGVELGCSYKDNRRAVEYCGSDDQGWTCPTAALFVTRAAAIEHGLILMVSDSTSVTMEDYSK